MSKEYPIVEREEYDVNTSVKIAGPPGAGKSTQIVRRIEEFLKDNEDSTIRDVVFMTYRKSLAEDIISRLKDKGIISQDFNSNNSYIGTIHAICGRMINNMTQYNIHNKATDYERSLFCKKYGYEYKADDINEVAAGKEIFSAIDWLKTTNTDVDDLPSEKYNRIQEASDIHINLRKVMDDWEEFKKNPPADKIKGINETDELYDFHELIMGVRDLELVPEHADLLVVDETHDVYPLLNDVLTMWMDKLDDTTVIVAGDPLQVINSYQGTSPDFFNNIDLPLIKLPVSYRCPKNHLDFAKDIIEQKYDRPEVEPNCDGGYIVDISSPQMKFNQKRNEWIIPKDKYNPASLYNEFVKLDEDALFLTRTNFQAKAIAKSLREADIPYKAPFGSWGNDGIIKLYNILCDIEKLPYEIEKTYSKSIVLDVDGEMEDYKVHTDEIAKLIDSTPTKYIKGKKTEVYDLFDTMSQKYEFVKISTIFRDSFFVDIKDDLESTLLSSVDVEDILHMADKNDWERLDESTQTAKIHTIHASKGMGSDNVFLYDGIPSKVQNKIEEDEEAYKNELRTWYVGATRSKSNLVLLRDAFKGFENFSALPMPKYNKKVINNEN